MKTLSKVYTALIFIILYAPIAVMVLFSFNSSNSTGVFTGFSTYWYKELFNDPATLEALKNTLVLAVSSSAIATIIGTVAAVGISKLKSKHTQSAISTVTNIPMMNPDIVTGISMMLLFVFVSQALGMSQTLSFGTVLIAHVTFNLPYVILSVMPKIRQMDKHLTEAAMDLGCTPIKAFFKVKLPNIMPGVLSGMVMAFTLSLDDFVISYFVGSSNFQTLPLLIYSMTKKKVTPDMYALSTLIIITIFILLVISNVRGSKRENEKTRGVKSK